MKKDKLEQFVQDHAGGFDALEPPVMAWDAIDKELPVARKSAVRRLWPYAWKVAAAVLIFASAWMLNDFNDQRKQAGNYAVTGDSSSNPALNELSDAEAFYATQISSRQAELAAYTRQHPEIIEDLKREFSEMDKKKAALKNDLAESNADEKVIEAIILSYRVKLEILDQMLTEMKSTGGPERDQEPGKTEL
ncbi:MAG: Uncharacterized protein FD166_890 [Bacteroidetes bacterium]|nr:MAG: Uncharacterized protein FD166_890 [Bacteroidota bacterium]